ncbi:zinc-ribbon domain protein [Acinetobacter sp. WC-743]|uniref:zinc-ribbon domain-containing protein n=1 Tax=Acinetobacter sp. WC-743 TaxID=903945 RepID=UPI0002AEBF16|nr:zinc-ribbon domain-containing protein [Acinetobacter sp. WC-743]ELW82113.1 zinc-ribbon domain protein [Acinetobacter sp. WC-743]
MAIHPCKECGAQVSDKAKNCPQCGAKIVKQVPSWIVVAIIFIACAWVYSCVSDKSKSSSQVSVNSASQSKQSEELKKENWEYLNKKDDMRDIETKFAFNESLNSVDFDFPYSGGSKLTLILRKNPKNRDVMLSISKGQFICGISDCEAQFKFDDNPIKSITMSESDTHKSDTLFVTFDKTEDEIINKLKSSKKLVVEVKFYQEGAKQFTFDVSNLNW